MIKVFYHSGTVDSKLCAWALNLKHNVTLIPFDYADWCFNKISEDDTVFICGITLNQKMFEAIEANKPQAVHVFAKACHPSIPKHFNLYRADHLALVELWAVIAAYSPLPKFLREIKLYTEGTDNKNGSSYVKRLSFCIEISEFFSVCDSLAANEMGAISEAHSINVAMNKYFNYIVDSGHVHCCSELGEFLVINSPKLFNEFLKPFVLSRYENVLMYHDSKNKRHWAFMSNQFDTRKLAENFGGYGTEDSSGWIGDTSNSELQFRDILQKLQVLKVKDVEECCL